MDITPVLPASRYSTRSSYGRGEGSGVSTKRAANPANPSPENSGDQDSVSDSSSSQTSVDAEIDKLEQTDLEVRAHEAAHMAAAGGLASGGPHFIYKRGPNGKLYAVGGEVRIQVSGGPTPEVTIARARQVRAAALAPGNPSPEDLAVAAQASAMEAAAQTETAETTETSKVDSHESNQSPDQGRFMLPYLKKVLPPPRELWAQA
jgi:hypothetical protein